jgi:hypothetical protein
MILGLLLLMAAAPPSNPMRQSPPHGLGQRALPTGAIAPVFTLQDANGRKWSIHRPAVLVFYRGHW